MIAKLHDFFFLQSNICRSVWLIKCWEGWFDSYDAWRVGFTGISIILSSDISDIFPGRLASARQRLGKSRVSSADVLGVDRDRVAIRITLACGARRRKELPGSRRRFGGSEGELVTPHTSRLPLNAPRSRLNSSPVAGEPCYYVISCAIKERWSVYDLSQNDLKVSLKGISEASACPSILEIVSLKVSIPRDSWEFTISISVFLNSSYKFQTRAARTPMTYAKVA